MNWMKKTKPCKALLNMCSEVLVIFFRGGGVIVSPFSSMAAKLLS